MRTFGSAAFFMLLMFSYREAFACAVCFGDPTSPQTAGLNMAILTLMGITGTMLSGIAVCGFVFWRRAVAFEREQGAQAAGEPTPLSSGVETNHV